MRLFLLMFLLLLCHGKPHQPIDVKDVVTDTQDVMMQDWNWRMNTHDDDDDDDDDDDYNDLVDCPKDCECSLRVVRCADKALGRVPKKIPKDTVMLDLQNNYISEIGEDDFKGLSNIYALFLLNNVLTKIHPRAFRDMTNLKLLYLSYNMLPGIPGNLPKGLLELRISDNNINHIQKDAFKGLMSLQVLEITANPLANSGIELGAFDNMATLFLRIAEAKLTAVPKDLPTSVLDLNLDYNKIAKVEVEDFYRYKQLQRLGLEFNSIKYVENGSFASIPNIREIRLDNNRLRRVPQGLSSLKYLQVLLLHSNKISFVGADDFCPTGQSAKKMDYQGISLFANPVRHWQIPPVAFRCVSSKGVHMGNRRK